MGCFSEDTTNLPMTQQKRYPLQGKKGSRALLVRSSDRANRLY
jgi:hypothetical protein